MIMMSTPQQIGNVRSITKIIHGKFLQVAEHVAVLTRAVVTVVHYLMIKEFLKAAVEIQRLLIRLNVYEDQK